MHIASEPPILYLGTPVVLIGTVNEDGSPNLAPMSSAFWLGWRCMLGLGSASQTAANIRRTGECTLNLPSASQVGMVDKLALTTARKEVPPYKAARGYRYVADKFGISGFDPVDSETIEPPRARQCPVQMEAVLEGTHAAGQDDAALRGRVLVFEVRVQRVWLDPAITMGPDRIDPDKWRPLIMSFQRYYGLGDEVHPSRLASIPEAMYRSPDVDRALSPPPSRAQPSRTSRPSATPCRP
ncbi:flavin reductase family protein [Ramlibacter albus]|uniref:Flavin reductase family protein n=1 Tax=Ramlibacter albus TaxID=2079448 RepID=A0A923MCW1_9BURK|nr:flavin reductase family protein [Ramlibacter albus]MBC5767216.1 flavin reductase family protein [Ramlibacter albus]